MKIRNLVMILTLGAVTMSCASKQENKTNYADLTKQYAKAQLTSDISHLSVREQLLEESESEVAQSCPTLCHPIAHQAPPSMEFCRQEYWSGLPFPSPGGSS